MILTNKGIKLNKKESQVIKKVKCTCCNSVLCYPSPDEHIDRYSGPETIAYIICLECGNKVITWAMDATDFVDDRIK